MRRPRSRFALAAIDPGAAQADLSNLWAAHAGAQALILAVEDADSVAAEPLKERLIRATATLNALMPKASTADEAAWKTENQRLNTELEQLQVDASVVLQDQRRRTQFTAALLGASVGLAGALGLWLLMRKRKR